jgi:hypothetical protein
LIGSPDSIRSANLVYYAALLLPVVFRWVTFPGHSTWTGSDVLTNLTRGRPWL